MKPFISACLVIKDEEAYLERCLKSIHEVVDEILLAHDGDCKDGSLEIARKYRARIFVLPFAGLPAIHRPFTFEQAKGDWILYIDADEYLSSELQIEILKLVQNPNVDAYGFNFPFFDGEIEIKKGPYVKNLRNSLFRKEKLYFIGLMDLGPMTYGRLVERWDLTLYHSRKKTRATWDYCRTRLREVWKLQSERLLDWRSAPKYNLDVQDFKNPLVQSVKAFIERPIRYTFWEIAYDLYWRMRNGLFWSNLFSLKLFFIQTLLKIMMAYHYLKKKGIG